MDLSKIHTGDSSVRTITVNNVKATQNVKFPVGFVLYKNNPVLQGGDIYSPNVLWNPVKNKYEMFYGGVDTAFPSEGKDNIFLAESPDGIAWTKIKTAVTTGNLITASVDENGNWNEDGTYYTFTDADQRFANDPCVLDIPDWDLRLMLYTGAGTYTNIICLATAPLYGDVFTKRNPKVNTGFRDESGQDILYTEGITDHLGSSLNDGNPNGFYENGVVNFWCFEYAPPFNIRHYTLSFSNGIFTVVPASPLIEPSLTNNLDADYFKWFDGYLTVGRGDTDDRQLFAYDKTNWSEIAGYCGLFGEGSGYGRVKVTPTYFFDKTGLMCGIYDGYSPAGNIIDIQIEMRMLQKGAKIFDADGLEVPATYRALDFNTFEITLSPDVFLPFSGSIKSYDEAGTVMSTTPQVINGGDIYTLGTSEPVTIFSGVSTAKILGMAPALTASATRYIQAIVVQVSARGITIPVLASTLGFSAASVTASTATGASSPLTAIATRYITAGISSASASGITTPALALTLGFSAASVTASTATGVSSPLTATATRYITAGIFSASASGRASPQTAEVTTPLIPFMVLKGQNGTSYPMYIKGGIATGLITL